MEDMNDLWFIRVDYEGIKDHSEHFILDASGVPSGKVDFFGAVQEAISMACGPDNRLSFQKPDPHIRAVAYEIGDSGKREHAGTMLAHLEDGRYVDHQGEPVPARDGRIRMFRVGDPV